PIVFLAAFYLVAKLSEARLTGGAVEVNEHNFADIHADLQAVSQALGYDKDVRAFVIQDGEINAVLWRVFGRRYIAFNSSLVAALTTDERRFIIGRFVGALRARHLRFHEAASLLNSFERLAGLNLLILPYLRASVYTGDRFGSLVLDDQASAFSAMDKLLVGNDLAGQLSLTGITDQAMRLRQSSFRLLSILFSAHPHMTDRYLELGSFVSGAHGGGASGSPSASASAGQSWPPPGS
ncbi:MAG: M48 family metallopeptidase, partial [Actinomycetota bacterium]